MELNFTLTLMGTLAGMIALATARRIAEEKQRRMTTALRVWITWESVCR